MLYISHQGLQDLISKNIVQFLTDVSAMHMSKKTVSSVILRLNFMFYFLVPVPSAPPQDVICTPVSAHDLQVTWNPPDRAHLHGIVQGYKLFYEPVEERYGG